jgi:uncharacterized membrane protein SpoIIM required for sporulation
MIKEVAVILKCSVIVAIAFILLLFSTGYTSMLDNSQAGDASASVEELDENEIYDQQMRTRMNNHTSSHYSSDYAKDGKTKPVYDDNGFVHFW